jgi:DNA-nicking Smr family endonuclease
LCGVDRDEDDSPFGRPVEIPIEDSIDLHYFRPSEQADVAFAYVEAAAEAGFREVRIVHGRGRGVQRDRIQRRLARSPHVERFADAPADRGGWGATVVWLRRDATTPAAGDEDPGAVRSGAGSAHDRSGRR